MLKSTYRDAYILFKGTIAGETAVAPKEKE